MELLAKAAHEGRPVDVAAPRPPGEECGVRVDRPGDLERSLGGERGPEAGARRLLRRGRDLGHHDKNTAQTARP